MKIKLLLIAGIVLLSDKSFSQSFLKKSSKSVYVLYGRHFNTKLKVDSGSSSLVTRKMYISWEAGLNLDYQLKDRWGLRTGISGHIQVISEITYGVTGNIPTVFPNEFQAHENRYIKGSESRERISIGIPIKAIYKLINSKRLDVSVAAGPYINFYFPTRDEEIRSRILIDKPTGGFNIYTKYDILRDFNKKKVLSGPDVTKPQLEFQLDAEAAYKFKRGGAIIGGLKAHLGIKNLERADYIIWPEFPQYRSKGHFTLNRSYIGIYAGYRFGSNSSRKK